MLLSDLERRIFNDGECLIPGVTHDMAEVVRQRSFYNFIRKIITEDNTNGIVSAPKILDLGCGVGHGCKLLSQIPSALITGVDANQESIEYARQFYAAKGVNYLAKGLSDVDVNFLNQFDYVISRKYYEQILGDAERWISSDHFSGRLILGKQDVEFIELGLDNSLHPGCFESFYQAETGEIDSANYSLTEKKVDSLLVVVSSPRLSPVQDLTLNFPVPAWSVVTAQQWEIPGRRAWFNDAESLMTAARDYIQPGEVSLEIGAGLHHNEFAPAPLQILGEPCDVYIPALKEKLWKSNNATYITIQNTGQELLPQLPDKCVDTTLMIDVIEHIEKTTAKSLLEECERVTRKQIVVFTPLGFLPQEHETEIDAWGYRGAKWQKHISGWTPEDFDESWSVLVCEEFHIREIDGKSKVFGAIFAIKNLLPVHYASAQVLGALMEGIAQLSDKFQALEKRVDSELGVFNKNLQEVTMSWYHRLWLRFYKIIAPFVRLLKKVLGKN